MYAIVLAGGFGTRLQSVVKDVPKPMADINGKPFLEYILDLLCEQGISTVVLSIGYKADIIKEHFNSEYKSMKIIYSYESEPLGTGGAIKRALTLCEGNDIVICNGDTYFNVNFSELLEQHRKLESDLTLSLKKMYEFDRYGSVKVQGEFIEKFTEKSFCSEGLINGGIYVVKKSIFSTFDLPEKFSFEGDFLERFISRLKIASYICDKYFIDIGIPEDYQKFKSYFKTRRVLFLDRDGIINVDKKYLHKKAEFEFVDSIFELCRFHEELGFHIIVITNQAGIGRGYYSEEDFLQLTSWMIASFENEGIKITDVFFCPHHPDEGIGRYKIDCNCRKPKSGMILDAIKKYNINLDESILIGDKKSDIEAGKHAGIGTNILIKSDYQTEYDYGSIKSYLNYIKGLVR